MGFLGSSWWFAVWMVVGLGVLLGLWWWVLVFCWDCSGGSIVFFFWYGLWPCG